MQGAKEDFQQGGEAAQPPVQAVGQACTAALPEQPAPVPGCPPLPAPRVIADSELALLSSYTGQADLEALRQHVVALWRRAISGTAPVYLCVRSLMFLEPRIPGHPAYARALALVREARAQAAASGPPSTASGPPPGGIPSPLWLDVGAALGTDVRQLRMEGLGQEEVCALDVPDARHYWQIGLELYQDASRPPCPALFADIIDDSVLPPHLASSRPAEGSGGTAAASQQQQHEQHWREQQEEQQQLQQLQVQQEQREYQSVRNLVGQVQVASCTAVLHCLGREAVQKLLSKIALLLQPGGLLVGSTLGAGTAREWQAAYQAGCTRWLHSAESLRGALEEAGYEQVEVEPTKWSDVERAKDAIRPIMESHVGGQLAAEEQLMLAFTAIKPALTVGAYGGAAGQHSLAAVQSFGQTTL